ncbi:MAG: heme o synthase [Vicinamibacterales bacterium]
MKDVRADLATGPLAVERRAPSALSNYLALTKPRLNLLVVLTSAGGYYLGAGDRTPELLPMAQAVAGTALVAGGAAVLNQLYERDTDALMRRTRLRPLPDGRVSPADARAFGLVLAAAGLVALLFTNVLAALLAAATLAVYLVVYTPMKRRSTASTLVGAIPGALPPTIGWAAADGSLPAGGWALFAIVFLWQIPHFMAIAWMYRDDYERAGFPMLPVLEPDGKRTGRQAVLYSVLLLPVSLVPTLAGVSGLGYFAVALLLGIGMIVLSVRFARHRTDETARALFYGSITYLPLVWAAMILNH